jgi:hypothetical protein
MTENICKYCIHAGEPYCLGDHEVVDCRIQAVTLNGFPYSASHATCSQGAWEGEEPVDEEEQYNPKNDLNNYITVQQPDGTVLTMYIPDTIVLLYNQNKELAQELEYLKRRSLWHLITRS